MTSARQTKGSPVCVVKADWRLTCASKCIDCIDMFVSMKSFAKSVGLVCDILCQRKGKHMKYVSPKSK